MTEQVLEFSCGLHKDNTRYGDALHYAAATQCQRLFGLRFLFSLSSAGVGSTKSGFGTMP